MASNYVSYASDLDALYRELLSHPIFSLETGSIERFRSLYSQISLKDLDYVSFVDAASDLTLFFRDGHTNIEIPYTNEDLCLPFFCRWHEDHLILDRDYGSITKGSRIIAVEDMNITDIIQKMTLRIPHENIFLVKSRMIHYPYKNYHVFSAMNLCWLFGASDAYTVTFSVSGKEVSQKCCLVNYNGSADFHPDNDFVSFTVSGDSVILRLDSCIYNDTYKQILHEVALLCSKSKIDSLILDLSNNMGGSSAVIDEFLRYVDVPHYYRYEMVDYSSATPTVVIKRSELVENNRSPILFPTKIYCKVSYDTFSSARTFAVTLKDNGIASIIGMPTGGKPSSFGLPRKGSLPVSGIRYRVSRCLFLRPDEQLDHEMTLLPLAEI